MNRIEIRGVSFAYPGARPAVRALSLTLREGETIALLGSSGCGKSTTLKLINGLLRPSTGAVFFEGIPLSYSEIYATRLKMGYVIQGGGLFPHMTVGENTSVMARMLGWNPEKISRRVRELLSLVGLEPDRFQNCYPSSLSGGQQQRVGVARALMLDPPVLLMDEPFGALDPITRRQLQDDFLSLEGEMRKTVVLVTHDVTEAFKLAHRIALMREGHLVQFGTVEEIKMNPTDLFVQEFIRQ